MRKATENKKHILRSVLLIILAVLVLSAGVVAYLYRDYLGQLSSLYKGFKYSSDEISSMKVENDKKTNELLNELVEVTMRDLTEEEIKLLASGELSESDAISLIQGLMPLGSAVADSTVAVTDESKEVSKADSEASTLASTAQEGDKPSSPASTTASTTASTSAAQKPSEALTPEEVQAAKDRISGIIAEIYLLRATYLYKIDDLIASSKLEYLKLPKEQRGLKGKIQIVDRYLRPKGKELEAECDGKMNALLSEMKQLLIKLDMSTGIIDEIEFTYKEQKELKMAELYGEYSPSLK